jgi:hypothetical protein
MNDAALEAEVRRQSGILQRFLPQTTEAAPILSEDKA